MTQSRKIGFFVNKIFIYDMLKRIPKSDISVRPFKAYKNWNFDNNSNDVDLLEAIDYPKFDDSDLSTSNNLEFKKHSLFGQLRAQFYNGHEHNPFLRFGTKSNTYSTGSFSERYLSGSAKVISIPQTYIGEGIKKGSFVLNDDGTEYIDDSFGNLISSAGDSITVTRVDNENGIFNFEDIAHNPYSASIGGFYIDVEAGTLNNVTYNGVTYDDMIISSFDVESGVMVVDNIPFLDEAVGTNKVGNVFYTQGLIVITKDSVNKLLSDWEIRYKSTQTIYENEYLLIVQPDEFNVSQNPTAITVVGQQNENIIDSNGIVRKVITNPGVKYIRKKSILENGNILDYRYSSSIDDSAAGFEHYDLSGSIDSTGSFLAPFITTIGLYDDDMDLVAVAKLPQPIKSEPDIPINFIVRFDT